MYTYAVCVYIYYYADYSNRRNRYREMKRNIIIHDTGKFDIFISNLCKRDEIDGRC